WGLEQEQAIGRNFFELNYPDALAKKLQRQIQQVVDSKVSVRDETPYTSPKGKTGHYEYIFSPVLSADGTVEVVAGSTRDITERTRLSVDLRKERAILAAIFEQAPAFICTLAGPDHVYELANERYYEIIGRRDIIGKTVRQALPEVEGQGFFELLDNVYRTGETFSGDQLPALLDRKGDGTLEQRFMNLVYRALRDLDGNVSGIFVHGVDVTDLVRAKENERAAKNEAEAANRAKDRFLAVLSHELRTPLSPVVMTIPAIEVDPDLPLKFREDLAMVRRNVDLEVRLIDDLLDLSRVIIGKLRLQMQPVRLHELLHHVIHGDMTDTPDKQLRIFEELRAGDDALFADPARLQQVFWNLLRNAAKFTPEGGRIDIRTWNADDTGDLFVEFKDTGVGIPPAMLGRIFDAFEQGEIGTTRQFGGLGLGLAIAKAVVEMHGGAIAAASEGTNRGATFTVRLPVRSAKTSTVDLAPPVQDMPQTPTPSHILLVEDHPDTARTMARLLEISGFKVKTAGTVESALQVAGAGTFDIIVSDIGLPDATGYELMEQIRDLYGIPGIALSGYGMEDDVRKSRESGFVEHVVKPVNIAQLELVIRRIIAESI
ncbi:MAG TPA: ATP-binding protein, partial [Tepidisphaeraceae bacterium]|nr:ATP-binding protein [Tepidisphaeraceae bacterium]